MRPFLWLLLASSMSCVSIHEATGDILLRKGDEAGAIREYQAASSKRPIIDWEYERLRDKRLRIVEGKWSPIVTEAITSAQKLSGPEAVRLLLRVRKDARADNATQALMRRLDVATEGHLAAKHWPVPASASVAETVDARLTLLNELRDSSATVSHLEAMAKRVDETLAVGLPPIPLRGDLDRLRLLSRWRQSMRALGFPAPVDSRLEVEFAKLNPTGFPPHAS